jgi:hypothetical protein
MVMALPGRYALRFNGFNRQDSFARHLSGLGVLELEATSATTGQIKANTGKQLATSTPMSGAASNKHLHGAWALSGDYTVMEAGPPLMASATIRFVQTNGGSKEMTNTYIILQTGPDRLTFMSKQPHQDRDENGNARPMDVHELSTGELIKVGADW